MLIDLVVEGREALIVGGGKEPEFKAVKLVDGKAKTTVLADRFTPRLRRLAARNAELVRLIQGETSSANVMRAIEETTPRVIFISTGDSRLDEELAATARSSGLRSAIVCVVDEPRLNDFNMPAIAKMGDVRIGVSTGGKSPAMAGILRDKIEKAIAPEDILQVKLQGYIRKASRARLDEASSRKEFAYRVIGDRRIGALLRKKDYDGARRLAVRMLEEEASRAREMRRRRRGEARRA